LQRDKDLREKFSLRGPEHFAYLSQSGCVALEGVDDAAKFDALRLAFEVVQIPSEKIDGIVSSVAAVLWLGNLKFSDNEDETASLTSEDASVVETTARLLGLREEELKQVLTLRQINIRGNVTEIPLKYNEARENR